MGVHMIRTGDLYADRHNREYLLDTIADVAKLPTSTKEGTLTNPLDNSPCAVGSTALVVEGMQVYILSPSDHWVII